MTNKKLLTPFLHGLINSRTAYKPIDPECRKRFNWVLYLGIFHTIHRQRIENLQEIDS